MAIMKRKEEVAGLRLLLADQQVGVLTHYSGGKNILVFSPDYVTLPKAHRHTLTLTQLLNEGYLSKPLICAQRLPPVLSNLLPEGALRAWLTFQLKVHDEDEFPLLVHTRHNLPGGLTAEAIPAGQVPIWALDHREQVEAVQVEVDPSAQHSFSLAGVQMKFSASRQAHGGFNIGLDANGAKLFLTNNESWIIKTPSVIHKHVPLNEYTAMRLAQAAGIVIPEIMLVDLTQLTNLPDIPLPQESQAYAIKRFDRQNGQRVHTEDFAQVFQLYSRDKYGKHNYEQIADALYHYSPQGLKDIQQMARRLLINILLANGDAHLKNWSVIYQDRANPLLSPAYDIVFTSPYVANEQEVALNMAKNKNWYQMSMASFETWAKRTGIPWPAVRVHLKDTLEAARDNWPTMLNDLPMVESQKVLLRAHWQRLHSDFRISTIL